MIFFLQREPLYKCFMKIEQQLICLWNIANILWEAFESQFEAEGKEGRWSWGERDSLEFPVGLCRWRAMPFCYLQGNSPRILPQKSSAVTWEHVLHSLLPSNPTSIDCTHMMCSAKTELTKVRAAGCWYAMLQVEPGKCLDPRWLLLFLLFPCTTWNSTLNPELSFSPVQGIFDQCSSHKCFPKSTSVARLQICRLYHILEIFIVCEQEDPKNTCNNG